MLSYGVMDKTHWECLTHGTVDSTTRYFVDLLTSLCYQYTPRAEIVETKGTCSWLDDACAKAIQRKHQAEGSDVCARIQKECAQILKNSYDENVANLKQHILFLPKVDKR